MNRVGSVGLLAYGDNNRKRQFKFDGDGREAKRMADGHGPRKLQDSSYNPSLCSAV